MSAAIPRRLGPSRVKAGEGIGGQVVRIPPAPPPGLTLQSENGGMDLFLGLLLFRLVTTPPLQPRVVGTDPVWGA
jgi:hypothetical protein